MNKLRKFLATVLIAALTLGLGSGFVAEEAQAVGNGTIKVTGAEDGKTYEAYRVFDVTKNGTATAYSLNTKWKEFFTNGDGASYLISKNTTGDLNGINVDGIVMYINITNANVQEFAAKAHKYALTKQADASVVAATKEANFSNLDLGYYLVFRKDATQTVDPYTCVCSLTTTNPNAETQAKGTTPTITKTADKETADVGQVVTYTITGTVPDTTGYTNYIYTVRDTMSGLTLTGDYTVSIGANDITGSPNITAGKKQPGDAPLPTKGGNKFSLNIDMTKYQAHVGEKVTITYDAIVNPDAVKGNQGNPNNASLEYSNNPADGSQTSTMTPPPVKVHTLDIGIHKHAAGELQHHLPGAHFVLYKKSPSGDKQYYHFDAATNTVKWVEVGGPGGPANLEQGVSGKQITEVVTTADGKATFAGLAAGTYFIKETVAPDGYNLLTIDKEVKVDKNTAADFKIDVANSTGSLLPGTGGIGTTIFYVVGLGCIFAALVLMRKRRAK